jgi:hypothetical protein
VSSRIPFGYRKGMKLNPILSQRRAFMEEAVELLGMKPRASPLPSAVCFRQKR